MKIDVFSGIFVYFILWWTLLFVVLPLNKNYYFSKKWEFLNLSNLKSKFLITTLASFIFWMVIGMVLNFYAPKYGFFYK